MKTILQEWQNSQKVLPVSLAWEVGDVCSDCYMIKGKNVNRFKIISGRIADCNQNFILQESITMLLWEAC